MRIRKSAGIFGAYLTLHLNGCSTRKYNTIPIPTPTINPAIPIQILNSPFICNKLYSTSNAIFWWIKYIGYDTVPIQTNPFDERNEIFPNTHAKNIGITINTIPAFVSPINTTMPSVLITPTQDQSRSFRLENSFHFWNIAFVKQIIIYRKQYSPPQ